MSKEQKNDRPGCGYFIKIVGLNVIIMAIVAVVGLLCFSLWLEDYTRHDERIIVPNLKGVSVEDAKRCLTDLGLRYEIQDSVYVNARPGSVIEQIPAAIMPIKTDRIVYLTINAYGVRMVRMQDVREGGSRQALSTLRSLGFVVDSVQQVPSENDDLVLSVTTRGREMEPGVEYPVGTHVVLHVGCRELEIKAENEESEEMWME